MGTRPCKQRAARLTAGALLILQISFIAWAPDNTAAADAGRPPDVVKVVNQPMAVGPSVARLVVARAYDVNVLDAARSYTQQLYRQAILLQAQTAAQTQTQTQGRPYRRSRPRAEADSEPRGQNHRPIRLHHAQAVQRLKRAGLNWTSSGGCSNRQMGSCTSLQAVRAATVASVIALKRRSRCPIVVTGGTEVGHASGRYSHYRGYKLDIKPNRCINGYIARKHPLHSVRGDGASLYGSSQTVYARESNHWDILFR